MQVLMQRRNIKRWARFVIKTCPRLVIKILHTQHKKQQILRSLLDRFRSRAETVLHVGFTFEQQAHEVVIIGKWELLFTHLDIQQVELLHRDVRQHILTSHRTLLAWHRLGCDVTKSVILGGWYLGLFGPKP